MYDYYVVIRISNDISAIGFFDIETVTDNLMDHVVNGNVVLVVDELEAAADVFKCEVKDIEIVEQD